MPRAGRSPQTSRRACGVMSGSGRVTGLVVGGAGMTAKVRGLLCLTTVAVTAGYVLLAPATREPFDDRGWAVESVMVMDPNTTTYVLDPPFRVLRAGRVTLGRPAAAATLPVVRVDLTRSEERRVGK